MGNSHSIYQRVSLTHCPTDIENVNIILLTRSSTRLCPVTVGNYPDLGRVLLPAARLKRRTKHLLAIHRAVVAH